MIYLQKSAQDSGLRWGRVSRCRLYGMLGKSSISADPTLQVHAGLRGTTREQCGGRRTDLTQDVRARFRAGIGGMG